LHLIASTSAASHSGDVLRTLSRVYNQLCQLQTHKDAYQHATGYAYDANGNTDTVTDALSDLRGRR